VVDQVYLVDVVKIYIIGAAYSTNDEYQSGYGGTLNGVVDQAHLVDVVKSHATSISNMPHEDWITIGMSQGDVITDAGTLFLGGTADQNRVIKYRKSDSNTITVGRSSTTDRDGIIITVPAGTYLITWVDSVHAEVGENSWAQSVFSIMYGLTTETTETLKTDTIKSSSTIDGYIEGTSNMYLQTVYHNNSGNDYIRFKYVFTKVGDVSVRYGGLTNTLGANIFIEKIATGPSSDTELVYPS
jgi:hypothetical protein